MTDIFAIVLSQRLDHMSKAFKPLTGHISTNIYEVNIRQYTPEGTLMLLLKNYQAKRHGCANDLVHAHHTHIA